MTHASLFSGIGGAEIAAAWMGWENLFHCDINEFGLQVLKYWFPKSKEYNDIRNTDFTEWRGRVSVLTAGFPCQPFSLAGKRKGADDDRYLWPETIRVIKEVRPAWFVGENVFGIASMVLPGEEADMGSTGDIFEEGNLYRTEQRYVIDRICEDIEDAGYSVQPVVIPACAVGAPHRRDRVWFVARREDDGHDAETPKRDGRRDRDTEIKSEERRQRMSGAGVGGRLCGFAPNPDDAGLSQERSELKAAGTAGTLPQTSSYAACGECAPLEEGRGGEGAGERVVPQSVERRGSPDRAGGLAGVQRADADPDGYGFHGGDGEDEVIAGEGRLDALGDACEGGAVPRFHGWEGFPTQPPVCRGDDGIPFDVAGITLPFGRWRKEALKALGNAWVPEVAYEIFKMIKKVENGTEKQHD